MTNIHLLSSMMKKKRFWVGYYVNKLQHMGNKTFNRVESTHANIKSHNKSSSGNMSVVTDKINMWFEKRVGFCLKMTHVNSIYFNFNSFNMYMFY